MTTTPKKADSEGPLNHIFCCDSCDYEKRVGPELSGRQAKCPKCGQLGRVGACETRSSPAQAGVVPAPGGQSHTEHHGHAAPARTHIDPTTRCPYCREDILVIARKCKHCGEYLDESLRLEMEHRKTGVSSSTKHMGQMSLKLPQPRVLIAGLVVALVVAGIAYWAFGGNGSPPPKPGDAKTQALPPPAFEPTLAAMRKGLEGTEVKDPTGTVRFLTVAEGEPWTSSVRKADTPDKPAHATIEASYRLTSGSSKTSSNRGKIILQFINQAGGWQFQSASRRICFVTSAGKEKEVPEDDQQVMQLGERDPILKHIRGAIQKTSPNRDD